MPNGPSTIERAQFAVGQRLSLPVDGRRAAGAGSGGRAHVARVWNQRRGERSGTKLDAASGRMGGDDGLRVSGAAGDGEREEKRQRRTMSHGIASL